MKSVGYSRSESSLFNVKPAASPVKTGARVGTLVAALMLAGGCWKDDPEATVLKILAENNPEIPEGDIFIEGCEFGYSATVASLLGGRIEQVLRADLSLYKLKSVRIREAGPDEAILILERKPFNDRLVEQAARIVELLPDEFQSNEAKLVMSDGQTETQENSIALKPGEGLERSRIEQLLKIPNGNLVFRLSVGAIGDEPLKPHKDAPVFLDFADRVRALPAPQSALISLRFNEAGRHRESLMTGLVTIPKFLQIRTSSLKQATELGRAMNAHQAKDCDLY